MKCALKRMLSVLLCVAMLLPFIVVELPAKVEATNHGEYDTLAMVYDLGSCPSMQGLGLCGDYFYAIKTDGDDYAAAVCRVNKHTGGKTWLTNSGTGTNYFYDFGHGNDCEVVVAGGVTTMFVPTSKTGSNSLVRYKISGSTATKVCGYQMVNTSGALMGGGAIRVARVDDQNIYLLFKTGNSLYTGTLPISQNGGNLVMTFLCTLDYSEVVVNGTTMDTSDWILQGFGYHDHMVYLPITGNHSAATINVSVIAVYDIEGASGTIKPLPDPTFRVTSSAYSALFEMESCVIDPETNLLYFNTNRRKTSSDTNYDGIHYITNWIYEPQNRTKEVNNYRWEMVNNKLTSMTAGSSVYNGLAMHQGRVSGGTISNGRYATSKTVVLEHSRPWIIEWKSNGCSSGELLFATQAVSNYTDAPYIFVNDNNSRVSIGAYNGSQYNNYGVTLSDHGIDGTKSHVYRLTNKPASDGSNMVYLSVDGKELGPMNNYYVASTSQGTTSNWVSGKDLRFSYIGTNNHPINDSIEYIQVWGNGKLWEVDEPDTFRWETQGNALTSIAKSGLTKNALTAIWGSISGGQCSGVQCDVAKNVVLLHNRPWSIEWKGSYSSGNMILAGDNMGNTEGSPYLFRSGILAFGERLGGAHHNYGIKLSDHGISYTDNHTFRLTNRIAADGSNMVYLYVDGVEIGAMNNYYKGTSSQGVTSDWLNGRDLTFTHLGAYQYMISGNLEYLQIWEGGIPAEDEPDNFRWETQNGAFTSVTSNGNTENTATMLSGAISGSTFTDNSYYRLDKTVFLNHDRPWSIQWESEGSWAGSASGAMLFSASNNHNQINAPYLYRRGGSDFIVFGEREGSAHHNYGIKLSDHGIDGTAKHTYLLTNRIAANGSNMVYLFVDGVEIGPMNHYYQGINDQGTTSDWINGKDFAFSFMGTAGYPINNVTLSYVHVFENCSHTFGAWNVKNATCTVNGSKSRSCTVCGYTETQTITATGHSYNKISYDADCKNHQRDEYICSKCGDCYIVYPDELMSDWVEQLPEGIDQSRVETKNQYRYSDYETTTSYSTALAGYTLKSSAWEQSGSGTINYVNSWPSGFFSGNSLYTKYNNKSAKKIASETSTDKTTINSDAVVGYLYYHWCYSGSYYSVESKSGSYTTFHAFYSTTNPSSLSNYDPSDNSYYYPNSACCSNSEWYWYVPVYGQKYTTYKKLFTYERWTDFSSWSDTAVTASATRKVETRTVYRYVSGEYGAHQYVNGICSVCGDVCSHSWNNGTCSNCAMNCGHSYNSGVVTTKPSCTVDGIKTYTCGICEKTKTETIKAQGHNYVTDVLDPTCTTGGYTTHTCSVCGDNYRDHFLAPSGHSYDAGMVTTQPTCTSTGVKTYTCASCGSQKTESVASVGHNWSNGICANCGEDCTHSFETGVCTICGVLKPTVIPVLNPTGATLSLEGEVMYKVYFTVDDPTFIKSMGMLTFNAEPANATIDNADEIISEVELVNGTYIASSNGIPAKMLSDDVYIRLYAQLQDGTYVYSRVIKYSGKIYADYVLDYRSDDPALQSLVVAMLNYGAGAQTFFGYKTDSLMNADLTANEKSKVVGYTSSLVPSRELPAESKIGNFPKSEQFSYRSASMVLEGALAINYRFVPTLTPDSGLTLYYWIEDTYNSVDALTLLNCDGSMEMTQDSSGYYTATYDGLAAKQMGDVIYVVAVYRADGMQHTTGVIAYSLYTYCNDAVTYKQPSAEIAKAAAVYGYYAENYFGSR